jgi:hypothetical protein
VAGGARLNAGARLRVAALLALVLLLHAVALDWLIRNLQPPSPLRPLADPMFTRLLQPQAPPAIAAPPQAAAAPAPRRAITSIARTPAAPLPAKPASQVAQARDEAASAPDDSAGAPSDVETGISTRPADNREPVNAPASSAPASAPTQAGPAAVAATPAASAASAPLAGFAPGKDPTALDGWPADTRLSYRLSGYFRGELYGDARVQWQRQDKTYQTRVDIDVTLFARLALTSQGEVTPQGLAPRIYEELRNRGARTARMGDETITLSDGRSVPKPQGVQDTASQFVELAHRFATGQEKLEVGRSVSFWMARPGGVDLWTYDIVQRETLQTALGPVDAFRLKPRPIANPRGNITAEMWFAPSLQYLPVRIRVNMGESTYVDLLVEKIEQR